MAQDAAAPQAGTFAAFLAEVAAAAFAGLRGHFQGSCQTGPPVPGSGGGPGAGHSERGSAKEARRLAKAVVRGLPGTKLKQALDVSALGEVWAADGCIVRSTWWSSWPAPGSGTSCSQRLPSIGGGESLDLPLHKT